MNSNNSSWPQSDYQLPLQIGNGILGLAGALTNLLVVWTIVKTKELHNRSQFAILSHAVAEFGFQATMCIIGFRGCLAYAFSWPALNQFGCMLLNLPLFVTSAADLTATMNLGIDRLITMKAPLFYRNLSTFRCMLVFNLIVWGYALIQMIEAFTLTAPFAHEIAMPSCGFLNSLTPLNQYVTNATGLVLSLLTVCVYATAGISAGYRYWGTKWLNEAQRSAWARNVQLEAFKTIMVLGCIYFSCSATAVAMYTVSNSFSNSEGALYFLYRYSGLLLNVKGITHLFVYLKRNRKFRIAFKSIVLRQHSTIVVSLQTQPTRG